MNRFCELCGNALQPQARFCSVCGNAVPPDPHTLLSPSHPPPPQNRLRRRGPPFRKHQSHRPRRQPIPP